MANAVASGPSPLRASSSPAQSTSRLRFLHMGLWISHCTVPYGLLASNLKWTDPSRSPPAASRVAPFPIDHDGRDHPVSDLGCDCGLRLSQVGVASAKSLDTLSS